MAEVFIRAWIRLEPPERRAARAANSVHTVMPNDDGNDDVGTDYRRFSRKVERRSVRA